MPRTVCPHCGKRLRYQAGLEGGTYECPKCKHGVTLRAPRDVAAEMKKTGRKISRVLLWSVIGLAVLGGVFLAYQVYNESAKQRAREAHRIQI